MPYIDLDDPRVEGQRPTRAVRDGVHFAHAAVRFANLGATAAEKSWDIQQYHLYALAIELGLKSLAIRSGATQDECRKAGHRPTVVIALIERYGTAVPEPLKTYLGDDKWFKAFLLLTRYPAISELNTSDDKTIFLHSDYPELIAAILEVPCKWPLHFEQPNALAEVQYPPESMILIRSTGPNADK